MMYRFLVGLLIVGTLYGFFPSCVYAGEIYRIPGGENIEIDPALQSALLIYDPMDWEDEGQASLKDIYSALRAQGLQVVLAELKSYPRGLVQGVQSVVVAGGGHFTFNSGFAEDLREYGGIVCWIGQGADKYSSYALTRDIRIIGQADEIRTLDYPFASGLRGVSSIPGIRMKDAPLFEILDRGNVEVLGSIAAGSIRYPYVVHHGNRWYIAGVNTQDAGFYVFHDLVYRIFQKGTEKQSRVYLKLVNVSPLNNLKNIEELGEWLGSRKIPFIMELAPLLVNQDMEYMKQFMGVVKKLQNLGGTAVLGNLSSSRGKDPWSQSLERTAPLSGSQPAQIESLMYQTLRAYADYRVYPMAFAAPPDRLLDPEFEGVFKHFSIFLQSGDWVSPSLSLKSDKHWNGHYIQEMEAVNRNVDQKARERGLSQIHWMKAAGGEWAVSLDSSASVEDLEKTVLYFRDQRIEIADFRQNPGSVNYKDVYLTMKDGMLYKDGKRIGGEEILQGDTGPKEAPLTSAGNTGLAGINRRVGQVVTMMIIIVSIFLFSFLLAFAAGRRIDRKKHLR